MATETCIPMKIPSLPTNQIVGIDGALALSMTNHRMYRQNMSYRMKIDLNPLAQNSNSNFGSIQVYRLSNTWMNKAAHREALVAYMNAKQDEIAFLKNRGLTLPRWRDFRTSLGGTTMAYPISTGFVNGGASPVHNSGLPTTGNADIEPSTVETTTGSRGFCWLSQGTVSLFDIKGQFQEVYNIEDTPETPLAFNRTYDVIDADNTRMLDGVNETELDNLTNEGDEPPYDKQLLPDVFTLVKTIGITNFDYSGVGANSEILRVNTTGWFDAPLGLVLLYSPDAYFTDESNGDICIEFGHGSYKGVKAEQYSKVRFDKNQGIYVGA